PTAFYPLSLHDALPISIMRWCAVAALAVVATNRTPLLWWVITHPLFTVRRAHRSRDQEPRAGYAIQALPSLARNVEGGLRHVVRSEEHTSELQSLRHLV